MNKQTKMQCLFTNLCSLIGSVLLELSYLGKFYSIWVNCRKCIRSSENKFWAIFSDLREFHLFLKEMSKRRMSQIVYKFESAILPRGGSRTETSKPAAWNLANNNRSKCLIIYCVSNV